MSRILARESCFKLMFEYEFLKEKNELSLLTFFDGTELTEEDKEYVSSEYDGLIKKNEEIESIIAKYLKGYTLNRIYKIDLAILKVAIYELIFAEHDTPSKVIINEAVELAKKYSTEKSYSFINGVLASVYEGEVNGKTAN